MNRLTSYLYATPSFVEGFSRLFDFGGTLEEYNSSLSSEQADTIATAIDWLAVGDDIRSAIDLYACEQLQITDSLIIEAHEALVCSK